jgi:hypothetical protein
VLATPKKLALQGKYGVAPFFVSPNKDRAYAAVLGLNRTFLRKGIY